MKKDHSPSQEREFQITKKYYLTMPGAWNIHFCHVVYRKYSVHQFHLQPFKIWRRSCGWSLTIITSVSQLATLPLQGICQGGQPIMSYNFGAGNKERVKKAFFTQFTVCTVFTGCFWLIMLLFPRLFAGIFSNDTDLITYTAWALRIYMAGIFSLGFQVSCQQSFMALGQAKVSLLLACLRKLILLIPLIFILPLFIQNKVFAVFLAEPISDILAAIITTSTFFRRFDKILDRR